ncbi:hypothetical protein HFO56_23720 [Rhizobium laguerreae]|uniref:ribosome modulation factor n=1 Tax=Rhizobium laguerreae TaxID=1076926 RepID=UPI001C922B09|nr:hypothetical protein [Rhizobium laguerreae]MBY3155336.1 hypothetical protein [Rhizobium laguerreae]
MAKTSEDSNNRDFQEGRMAAMNSLPQDENPHYGMGRDKAQDDWDKGWKDWHGIEWNPPSPFRLK